ncbi:succinyl-diaminopimelate desuccinylase [Tistrella sp. BH-R2-4]|uniref:Succinyl-diaminopimelate desuccinylase n=1 Tax=Tistrella arctica TaxID=3133430 RepID=A0ABU9YMR8_9PROT
MPVIDTVALARDLIRRPSVTPADAGALDVLQAALEGLGFTCHRLPFQQPGWDPVDNLYAVIGDRGPGLPVLGYAGHTDVVPVGDAASWTVDPFGGDIIDGQLWGRGAVDMKGSIAAFVAAVSRYLDQGGRPRLAMVITGDEERDAINGTVKMLDWMRARAEPMDHCLVGEPTNPSRLGEMIKIGRRGSVTGFLTVYGAQGHVAYPHLADNPVPRLLRMLSSVVEHELDRGTPYFQPSSLQVTTIDIGNPATNVIPGIARAAFNVRFNDLHSPASIERWIRGAFDAVGGKYDLDYRITGDAFVTEPGPFSTLVAGAVAAECGVTPELSTTGGTSDARFIKDYCPVCEFGLIGQTMHKVDERVGVDVLTALSRIYERVIADYMANPPLDTAAAGA